MMTMSTKPGSSHVEVAARGCRLAVATLLSIAFVASPTSAQDFDAVEIVSTDLGPGLYVLVGQGGNILASIGPDGVFLVDDQYAPLTPKIVAAIARLGGGPVRFVLNTHWHGDHTGGNQNLAGQGALIVAHQNVRVRMSSDQFIASLDRHVPPSPAAALPVVTFADSVTLHLNGHSIHAQHVDPAHTDGDCIVHLPEANVIHAGDVYFAGMYPFFDLSSGGRIRGVIQAVDRVLALADGKTTIVPGHGPVSNRKQLEAWREMVDDVTRNVGASIEAGQSAEQIVAAAPTAKWDARYGGGFVTPERFVRLVDASLRMGR